jgi:hypothetical protein
MLPLQAKSAFADLGGVTRRPMPSGGLRLRSSAKQSGIEEGII